jgi:epsilon-lactone hydrolase
MPSLKARIVGFVLRTSGHYRRQFTGGERFAPNIARARAAPPPEPSARIRGKLAIRSEQIQGQTVWTFAPQDREPTAHLLYWHGGGYIYTASSGHLDFLAHMAKSYGWHITAPLYPLAPENSAPAVTGWALDFYRNYLASRKGHPFVMGGDSAGGGLTASISMLARDAGLKLPAGLILICPWLNAEPVLAEQRAIEPRDGILTISGIESAGIAYAGNISLTDARVSPIHGDWGGLPSVLCYGGGDDILVTDSRALKAKMPSIEYTELAGLLHVWPLLPLPESKIAQARMAAFAMQAVT